MVRARIPLIAFGVATLVLAACGSDNKSKDSSSTSSTTATASTSIATTTTLVGGTSTQVTVAPVTAATVATTATTVASSTGGATTTTVKGRVVTSPSDNVKLGDTGDGVKKIQFALKAAGYKVTVDGDFGNQTDAAVRQFQKKNGLKVDGIVGKVTWAKLSAASNATGATTTTTK